MYYLGIDVGGTTIKGIIIDGSGKISAEDRTETKAGGEAVAKGIASLVGKLLKKLNLSAGDVAGVGIGCPGVIDSARGRVVFAGNLGINDYPLAQEVACLTGMKIKLTNDANAAALGEAKFGAGSAYGDSIFVTLGTGVGGGIIIGGKLFEGGSSAGTEIGHMVIVEGGKSCTCGRRGCWEAYASATALIEATKEAMLSDKNSAMWECGGLEKVTGETPFIYCGRDGSARRVVDEYIGHLACGIVNLANIFRPEAIILGGGVSAQGERLNAPLREILSREIMGGTGYAPVKIVTATLGSRAGAFGAAALFMAEN